MGLGYILALLTLLATVLIGGLGGTFAIIQWNKSNRIRRTEFVNQILEKFRFDEKLANTIYKLDYSERWYDDNFHNSKEKQYEFDSLFAYLTYVCYLRHSKSLTAKDFTVFEYIVKRACMSHQTQEYLWNLHHWAKRNNTASSYQYLIEYLKKSVLNDEQRKVFDSNTSPNANGYKKRINI